MNPQENFSEEAARIRCEYERREKDLPRDFYSLEHPGNLFSYTQRVRRVMRLLKKENLFPLSGKKILEIGCGKGDWLVDFESWGAQPACLHGMDLDEKRLEHARARVPQADLRAGDASRLPWPDESFDLVLQSTVFTSILSDGLKQKIAAEMKRVLKPSGMILWYDFHYDNPQNKNVKGVRASEIRMLFKGCRIQLEAVTLAPPLSRCLAKNFWILCLLLEKLKILNSHYLGIIKKPLPRTVR